MKVLKLTLTVCALLLAYSYQSFANSTSSCANLTDSNTARNLNCSLLPADSDERRACEALKTAATTGASGTRTTADVAN